MSQGAFWGNKGSVRQVDSQLATYLSKLTGGRANAEEFKNQGFSLKDNKLYLGDFSSPNAREVLGNAEVIRMPERASNAVGNSFSRAVVGMDSPPQFNQIKIEEKVPGKPGTSRQYNRPTIGGMPFQVIGGQTKGAAALNRVRAVGSEALVYRFNSLLTEDFQTNFLTAPTAKKLKGLFPKFFEHGLGVKPTTPLRTLGHLTGKLGVLTGVVGLGYPQVDWLTSEILGFGPTKAIMSGYVGAKMAYAHALDTLDLSVFGLGDMYDLQDWFEETIPGSASMWNIPKLAVMGGVSAGFAVGALERVEAWKYAKNFQGEGAGWKAREAVNQQFRDFGAGSKDLPAPLSKLSNNVLEIARRFGTGQAASGAVPASYYEDSSSFIGGLWKRFMMKDIAKPMDAVPLETMPINLKFFGRATTTKVGMVLGSIAGLALGLPATMGGLVDLVTPDERPEELEAIYSGSKEVPIKKGRFWEFGRTDIEGEEVLYYRPHWYPREMSDYKEKAIWGEEADFSPLRKFFLKNFTYHLEEKHFYDRPYPITAMSFTELPMLGEVVGQTLGRIVKPPKFMHSDEWKDGGWYKVSQAGRGEDYALDLGETPGGIPDSPYSFSRTFGTLWNNFSQQSGLPGFVQRTIVQAMTGTEGIHDQGLVLDSFNKVTSDSRAFYDSQLGNVAGLGEAYRRIYPVEERGRTTYNPIKNTMPGWLPGAGSRSIDFQHGDPYTKIREGEYRLPGRGYAARFKELEGVDPGDYSLIHKYKILADVAPFSREFINISEQAKSAANSGGFSDYENSIYESTSEQLKIRNRKKEFAEYVNKFGDQNKYGSNTSKGLLSILNKQAASTEDRGMLRKAFGAWGEQALHFQSSLEQLTPLSPEAKFNKTRSAVEDYERDHVYGTTSSFWNRPIRDFIAPTGRLTARSLGWKGISGGLSERRDLESYFDVLKYVKNTRLANIAALNEDEEAKVLFERRKDQTLFGMNPYTANDISVMRALPRRDKDYYDAFSNASSPEERERILEMVPRNQRNLYLARWKLKYVEDLKNARDQEMLFGLTLEKASDEINAVYQEARSEGFPSSPEMYKAFMESKHPGENYPDWYRRTQILSDMPLPGADWIGWHPSVDLEDVKLKTVLDLGEDMHDFNLWPSRLNRLASKPYINDDAVSPILRQENLSQSQMIQRIEDLFLGNQMYAQIESKKTWGFTGTDSVSVELEQ
jgi:hypothetical protein